MFIFFKNALAADCSAFFFELPDDSTKLKFLIFTATLKFGSSPSDRLSDIPIKQVNGGYYYESQFTLGDGRVVHDYLK